jgi:flagellar basal-body rod protein FlgF
MFVTWHRACFAAAMDSGLYSGVAAMRASERQLDAIAANLANVDSPAYKRQNAVTHQFTVGTGERRHDAIVTKSQVDFSQGELRRTGNALDLALEGDGFFVVETPTGEAFTRNGSFNVDEQGVLRTADGHPVAWDGGRGKIDAVGEAVTIDATGVVRQGATQVGKLALVDFASKDALVQDREGYYHAGRGEARSTPTALVHQGAIEESNSASVDELVEMIRVQRNFESAASLVRTIDQSYRRLNAPR